ncbi:MAG: YkgJ family cysteine cluster protein, partial [Thermoplasmata archaeon]|nr:YkgJ family cysteine cluster protein [Thermoplasmata archaeon]
MARPDDSIEIDYSEVKDRTYRCLDGCGLCCLCQPELLPEEEKKFRGRPELSEGITEKHISPEVRGAAIKLRGAHGSCYFLSNKRCRIYGDRPHYCRAFPINVFVGWRIQLNANLSCRGMALEGEDLEQVSRSIIDGFGNERLARELKTAKTVFTQFVQNTRAAWVAQSFTSLRGSAALLMDEMVDRTGIARLLTYAEHGRTKQNAPGADIAKLVRKTDAEADVDERAVIDGTELFDLPDLSLLPIYIDEQSNWRIFRLVGKEIIGYVLDEDGSTSEFSRTAPTEVDLLPMDSAAQAAMKDYLA